MSAEDYQQQIADADWIGCDCPEECPEDNQPTFVCLQCSKRCRESDRAKGEGMSICIDCDDDNGFRALANLLNLEKKNLQSHP